MSLWSKRVDRVENAKTRAIEVKAANGHDKDEAEDEVDVDEELEKAKEEVKHLHSQINHLKQLLEDKEFELKRMRSMVDKHTDFMHNVIIELIHKPSPKSAAEVYAERKSLPGLPSSSTAGPKGKLP